LREAHARAFTPGRRRRTFAASKRLVADAKKAAAVISAVAAEKPRGSFGSVQRAILQHLADAPANPAGDVFDLRPIAKTVKSSHHLLTGVFSRAVHALLQRGVLEWMMQAGADEFRPARGEEGRVRFVRRSSGS